MKMSSSSERRVRTTMVLSSSYKRRTKFSFSLEKRQTFNHCVYTFMMKIKLEHEATSHPGLYSRLLRLEKYSMTRKFLYNENGV